MKKLTAVFIACLFAYAALSQGQFRLQAGPVLNYLHSEGNSSSFSEVHVGFTLGAAYEMIASPHFSIQPELNYTVLNTTEAITGSEIKFHYVQVPVLLKLVNDRRSFSVYLGPQIGFLTNATSRNGGHTTNIKDNLTQNDFSALLGMEFLVTQNLFLNVRFTHGLSNVYKVEFDSPAKSRHEMLGLTVYYAFHKKK